MHKIGTNYPTIKDIFDNYNESIKTLIKTSRKNNFNLERNNAYPSKEKSNNPKAESYSGFEDNTVEVKRLLFNAILFKAHRYELRDFDLNNTQ